MSNTSSGIRENDPSSTNNDNKSNDSGNNILSGEGCVQAAKEYLKVARSHVEEFARFVEAWESAQKLSTGIQLCDAKASISEVASRSSQSSKASSPARNTFGEGTEHIHDFLSNLSKNSYIYNDPILVSRASVQSTDRGKRTLVSKDRNRALRPNSATSRKDSKGRNANEMGSNAATSMEMPSDLNKYSQCTPTRSSNVSGSIIDELPFMLATGSLNAAASANIGPPSMSAMPLATLAPAQSFEALQLPVGFDSIEGYDDDFNLGLGLDQDPLMSPSMAGQPPIVPLQNIFDQFSQTDLPTAEGPPEVSDENPFLSQFGNASSFLDDFQTPGNGMGLPSLETTPWTLISQCTDPVTPEGPLCTPTRKPSGQSIGMNILEVQGKEKDVDWPLEWLDHRDAFWNP